MNSLAQNALSEYQGNKNSSISYANPHELILRLMDGALERIAQAKGAIQQNNKKEKGELIGKSISIIGGLSACLDHEQKSEISSNLDALYEYMNVQLLSANINEDVSKLDEVTHLMSEIKSAWVQIPQQLSTAQK